MCIHLAILLNYRTAHHPYQTALVFLLATACTTMQTTRN